MRRSEPRSPSSPGFGRPLVFDLTAVQRPREEEPPTVYYLVPREPVSPRRAFPWRTVAGFTAVIGIGLGLGLVLARLLMIV